MRHGSVESSRASELPLTFSDSTVLIFWAAKWVTSLAWEPHHAQKSGEPRLASSSKDSTVRIWSTNQQTIEMVLSGHKGSVSCVKWGGIGFIYTGKFIHTSICSVVFLLAPIKSLSTL
jgi:WD40 repeat protein